MTHQNNEENDGDYSDLIDKLRQILASKSQLGEFEERRELVVEELNWFSITKGGGLNENYHTELLQEIDAEIGQLNKGIEDAKKKTEGFNAGPCYLSIDNTLKKLGIELEKYFGGCFVGIDCHKLLRKKNSDELFRDLSTVVSAKTADVGVFDFTVECCEKFKILLSKYADCHDVFNSTQYLDHSEINKHQIDIDDYMAYLREHFPEINISPKLHMLEEHMIPFISKWKVGCGFFGEQGGESIHAAFNNMAKDYRQIKKGTERLKNCMKQHLASTNPNARAKRVHKVPRNLKRKVQDGNIYSLLDIQ